MSVASDDGNNEWGVLVGFLLRGCFWKTDMAIGEFNVMGYDVGSGLCGIGIVGLEAFNEKYVRAEAAWACGWGRKENARK